MIIRAIAATAVCVATFAIVLLGQSSSANAQYTQRPPSGGLLGAIIQAGAKSHAQKSWQEMAPPLQECVDRALSLKGNSIARLINQGIGADDVRLTPYISRCQELTTRELRLDFECTIVEAGVSLSTRCNEEYAEATGAQMRAISRDQYILDGLRGERVFVTQLETHDAMQARVDRDAKQQADADAARQQQDAEAAAARQQQEAAATAAAEKQAEAARKKQEAADAAIRQSFAQRDAAIQLSRRACSVKEAGAFSKMFSTGSDHDVLAALLNTNIAPLQTYQQLVQWLPRSTDREALQLAFHDRIEFDSKRWGTLISRSASGDYSWETLKASLAAIAAGCLWQQYDQLGVGAALAISPSAVAISSGQMKAATDADRVSAIVLSRIPSKQFFHH
jgi:hypothetical protein